MIKSIGTGEDNIKVMDGAVVRKANLVDKTRHIC